MDRPIRIQRKRTKGWRMPPNTVYVGRPTKWGNPHSGARWDDAEWDLGPYPTWAACVVDLYRRHLADEPVFMRWYRGTVNGALSQMTGDAARARVLECLPTLRSKNLACWCAIDQPCHADVLLELANPELSALTARGAG